MQKVLRAGWMLGLSLGVVFSATSSEVDADDIPNPWRSSNTQTTENPGGGGPAPGSPQVRLNVGSIAGATKRLTPAGSWAHRVEVDCGFTEFQWGPWRSKANPDISQTSGCPQLAWWGRAWFRLP